MFKHVRSCKVQRRNYRMRQSELLLVFEQLKSEVNILLRAITYFFRKYIKDLPKENNQRVQCHTCNE